MNKIKKIILVLFLCVLAISLYTYFGIYNKPQIDVYNIKPELKINSVKLTNQYIQSEKTADTLYKNKVIEIEGIIKAVTFLNNRNTLILYGNNESGVICDIQDTHNKTLIELKKGNKVKLKGVCKGFLKDVILLNCVLIN